MLEGPATGHRLRLYLAHGPPGGGVTLTVAVVGLVTSTVTAGDLQSRGQSPEFHALHDNNSHSRTLPSTEGAELDRSTE